MNSARPRLWTILPVRGLHDGKRRLAGALTVEQRAALVRLLLCHAWRALDQAGLSSQALVVSPDPAVLALAERLGALPLPQTVTGLNPALEQARETALMRGAEALLVVLPDLPRVEAADLRALLRLGAPGRVVLVPDRHGCGTNALLQQPAAALPFAFGADSLQRHAELARACGLDLHRAPIPGMILDVDTLDDLRLAGLEDMQRACAGVAEGG
ncbi:2-phospho-L-lactate guanylyltransferase [Kallotenue papyrolyticum]|uniref:2-phospho-L-lactate guanylyltransferase n=1 Tax=Kallotenue papyrolyticum TaxID=1325125 RepID=UPI00069507BD|nr:2-phospho-L-lactate guanylyltransferase [Kallotenue papyrolyticum]